MKRPRIITVICIIGYLSVLFTFPQVFSPPVKKLGVWMPALYGIIIAAQFISYVGMWYYKQWGVSLFTAFFFIKTLFFILNGDTGAGFYISTALSMVFVIVLLRHYPRMSPNL